MSSIHIYDVSIRMRTSLDAPDVSIIDIDSPGARLDARLPYAQVFSRGSNDTWKLHIGSDV